MSKEQQPFSIHSFMLPIRWDYLPKGYDLNKGKESVSFENRTDLHKFSHLLTSKNSGWKRKFFRINGKSDNYNEYHYFHSYASSTLFDLQQPDEKTADVINSGKVMLYYDLIDLVEKNDKIYYEINTLVDGCFKLNLTGISLHVYNTGIAILTFNLENYKYETKEEVLKINEYGRRIYPQFLNDTDCESQNETKGNPNHTKSVKEAFLAASIQVIMGNEKSLSDDFNEYIDVKNREVHHFDNDKYERSWVVRMPAYIRNLFNENFCFVLKEEEDNKKEKIRLNVLGDDRMFFQCWYGNEFEAKLLTRKTKMFLKSSKSFVENEPGYLKDTFWYAYIFGDKDPNWPSIANQELQADQSKLHTYSRWSDYGTLFGFSKDSFVSITNRESFSFLVLRHMKSQYYQIAVLCLAHRASLLRFSAEISRLADLARMERDEELVKNIKILYRNYIEFINKINFREITPYIQGVEMYSQFRDVMKTQQDVEALNKELNELFTYINLYEDEKQSVYAEKLNKIAIWFLPASFLASLFGISFISESTTLYGKPVWSIWLVWLIIILVGFLISKRLLRRSKPKKP